MVDLPQTHLVVIPPCDVCGAAVSSIELVPPGELPAQWDSWGNRLQEVYVQYHRAESWRFLFESIEGGNGIGDDIGTDEVAHIMQAFEEQLDFERVHDAGLYDDAGFCGSCRVAYCRTHWSMGDGVGRCPQGHFKSLDPHWHPE